MARLHRSHTCATPEEDKASSRSDQDLSRRRRRKRKAEEDSDGPSPKPLSNSRENTGANTNSGTFDYAPPELYSEGWYQADSTCVWQVGALLYELLNADKRFNTQDYVQKKLKFKNGLSKDCRHSIGSGD